MKRWLPVLVALVLFAAVPARAQVGFDIHVGNMPAAPPPAPPPVIVVDEPPEMVFVPEIGFYVAVGIPYDVVYISGRYYYFHGGGWYGSPYYNGPWATVGPNRLPPGLRRYKIEKIHEYREVRGREYKEHGPKFKEKHFQGRGEGHDKEHGDHPGKGHGGGKHDND